MKHIKPGAPQAIAHTQILPGVLPPEGAFTQQILEAAMSSTLVSGLKKRIWKEERRKASAGVVPSEITYFELIVSIPSFSGIPWYFEGCSGRTTLCIHFLTLCTATQRTPKYVESPRAREWCAIALCGTLARVLVQST